LNRVLEDQSLKLKDYLNEELAIYRELLGLSKKKQKVLMERFSTDLLHIVGEEEKQIQKLAEIEEKRIQCVEKITGKPHTSLDELVENISDTIVKSDIWMLANQLKDVLAEIQSINSRNQKLLEQALELTQYSISLLTTPPREVTYRAPGSSSKGPQPIPTLIDRKA